MQDGPGVGNDLQVILKKHGVLLSSALAAGLVGLPAGLSGKVGGALGLALDVLGDVDVALTVVVVGGSGDLRRAGGRHGTAGAHGVAEHQAARLPDHVGQGGVGLGQGLGVGVDGVLQAAGAGGDVNVSAATA